METKMENGVIDEKELSGFRKYAITKCNVRKTGGKCTVNSDTLTKYGVLALQLHDISLVELTRKNTKKVTSKSDKLEACSEYIKKGPKVKSSHLRQAIDTYKLCRCEMGLDKKDAFDLSTRCKCDSNLI